MDRIKKRDRKPSGWSPPPASLCAPIIVENVVSQIDEVVRGVRFEGWQSTIRGDQEVRQALRKTLYVQFKIRDNDVYEKALGYVREYY